MDDNQCLDKIIGLHYLSMVGIATILIVKNEKHIWHGSQIICNSEVF
jgi:hypothetical protein